MDTFFIFFIFFIFFLVAKKILILPINKRQLNVHVTGVQIDAKD